MTDVWIGGVRMVADRRLASIDEAALARAHARLAAQARGAAPVYHDERHFLQRRTQRRSRRAREVLRRRASLVGHRQRVPAAARDQSACASPGSRTSPAASRTSACSTSAAAAASCPKSMAARGAQVTGIDLSEKALGVARLHGLESGIRVEYRLAAAEALAAETAARSSTSSPAWSCSSTCPIRRRSSPRARRWRGRAAPSSSRRSTALPTPTCTRSSARSTCCSCCRAARTTGRSSSEPAELAGFARRAGLDLAAMTGVTYNPLTKTFRLAPATSVNYIAAFRKPAHAG